MHEINTMCTWTAGTDWFYNTPVLELCTVSGLTPTWSGTGLRLITSLSFRAPVLLPWRIQSRLILQSTTQPPFSTPVFPGPPVLFDAQAFWNIQCSPFYLITCISSWIYSSRRLPAMQLLCGCVWADKAQNINPLLNTAFYVHSLGQC